MASDGSYEAAVFDEQATALAASIVEACNEASAIPNEHIRTSIIVAAMITAAQVLDGNDMPRETEIIKPNGIAALLQAVLGDAR